MWDPKKGDYYMKTTKKALSLILVALIVFGGVVSNISDVSAFPISGVPTAIKNAVLDFITKDAELVAAYRDVDITTGTGHRGPFDLAYDCEYLSVCAIGEVANSEATKSIANSKELIAKNPEIAKAINNDDQFIKNALTAFDRMKATRTDFDIMAYVQSRSNPLLNYSIPCTVDGDIYVIPYDLPAGRYDAVFLNGQEGVTVSEGYILAARSIP